MLREYRNIELQSVLNEVKESFLPKGDERALLVSLNYSANFYLEEALSLNDEEVWEIMYNNKIEIMFYNPNNYCRVGYRINNPYGETNDFIQVANHDSCWKDGVDRCLKVGYEDLDRGFTSECEKLGLDEDSDIIRGGDIRISKDFGIGRGMRFIEEPVVRPESSEYDSNLKVNF